MREVCLSHDLGGDRPLVIRADDSQRRSAEHEVEERLVARAMRLGMIE
jgi:hypothetical protein